eukprot:1176936-Prorocentrum_minimum.AAC.1
MMNCYLERVEVEDVEGGNRHEAHVLLHELGQLHLVQVEELPHHLEEGGRRGSEGDQKRVRTGSEGGQLRESHAPPVRGSPPGSQMNTNNHSP